MKETQIKIFLSYSWSDFEIASIIDSDLSTIGLKVTRDIRDINYMDSIPNFMQSIVDHDFVLILLSDSYLRSENCMFESLELLNSHRFDKKVLPITLPPVNFYKPEASVIYYQHWDDKISECSKLLEKYQDKDILNSLKQRKAIRNSIDSIISTLKEKLIKNFTTIKEEGYRSLLEKMGFDENLVWKDLFNIKGNFEEMELQFEDLEKKWGDNKYIALAKAAKAEFNGQHVKAEKYYKDGLGKHPNFSLLLCDYADFLIGIKSDYTEAGKLLVHAIECDSLNSMAWNNYGFVTEKLYNDKVKAFRYYSKAIELDLNNSIAHRNLGLLYIENKDTINGYKHLQLAVKINPFYFQAQYDLGIFYVNKEDKEAALKHFKLALDINPTNNATKHVLATLLATGFRKYDEARKLFHELFISEPKNAIFHIDYAFHCLRPMQHEGEAMKHIVYAFGIDNEASIKRAALLMGEDPEKILSFIKNK